MTTNYGGIGTGLNAGAGTAAGAEHTGANMAKDPAFEGPVPDKGVRAQKSGDDPLRKKVHLDEEYIDY